MAEINFTGNEVWRWLPLMRGGIAFFELRFLVNIGIAPSKPGKVALRVIDHLFGKIGAVDLVTHKGSLLKNDAGATEWIEETAGFGAASGEVDKNLGKFWWKHTDESVTGRASLVAFGIGGDILSADRGGKLIAKLNKFDMIELFAELVMMCSSARDRGGFTRDKADIAAVALQKILVL